MSEVSTTLVLTASEVRAALSWQSAMDAIGDALRADAAHSRLATVAEQIQLSDGSLHLKAGGLTSPELLSTKSNVRPRTRRAYGTLVLFGPSATAPLAVIDSGYLTAFRTGAVAAVGALALGAPTDGRVAVLGAGPIGAQAWRALHHAQLVGELHVWSRSDAHAAAFAQEAGLEVPVTVHSSPQSAAQSADVVVTCTPTHEPILRGSDVRADAVLVALGSDETNKREFDLGPAAGDAQLVADDVQEARRVGELRYLPSDSPVAPLGRVLVDGPASLDTRRLRLFDSVGTGVVDTAVAYLAMTQARRQGLGRQIDFAG